MINLTSLELEILTAMNKGGSFSYFDEGMDIDSHTYTEVFAFEIASLLGVNENAAGAHISNLIQKGIFKSFVYDRCSGVEITANGAEVLKTLKERVEA